MLSNLVNRFSCHFLIAALDSVFTVYHDVKVWVLSSFFTIELIQFSAKQCNAVPLGVFTHL